VRSSAVDEDGAAASFAGQHDTVLGVDGVERVWWAISRCTASFAGERAAAYRRRAGLPDAPERAAVLVQWLVPADAAGVVFSANPLTGARDEVLVNAAWGLGESVVSGTVTPDLVVVDRASLSVRGRVVADKARMTVPAPGGVREVPVPARLARMPAIDDAQARAAAALAVALERETGRPVDLEVAWAGAELFLLQCRPITTLSTTRSIP
jgi:pyruvate,water dikinase